ncbi:MAG: hypothetical protein ACKODX_12170 [Gemmata sp.]|jgi:hypothetical protein
MTEPNAEPVAAPAAAPPPVPAAAGAPLIPPAILPLMRLLPPPEGTILAPPEPPEPTRHGWFLVQLWAELRLAVRMYFDPRYRISRTAQLAFPLAAVLMVLNYFFFAQWLSLPVFSPLVERVLYVLLGVFLYRVLQRELDRYKAVLDYLARFTHQ